MKTIVLALLAFLALPVAHAGAWGAGSFENDEALDWVAECAHTDGIAMVTRTLDQALNAKYIETTEGTAAIVAAEVVAAALGKPSAALPRDLRDWMHRQSLDKLTQLAPNAKKALARIHDSKLSELAQLWKESKLNDKWRAAIAELSSRLGE
jgi:hypothetical protein